MSENSLCILGVVQVRVTRPRATWSVGMAGATCKTRCVTATTTATITWMSYTVRYSTRTISSKSSISFPALPLPCILSLSFHCALSTCCLYLTLLFWFKYYYFWILRLCIFSFKPQPFRPDCEAEGGAVYISRRLWTGESPANIRWISRRDVFTVLSPSFLPSFVPFSVSEWINEWINEFFQELFN